MCNKTEAYIRTHIHASLIAGTYNLVKHLFTLCLPFIVGLATRLSEQIEENSISLSLVLKVSLVYIST